MSKQFVYDVMPENRDVIVFFLIYGKIVAIRKLDFGRMVRNLTFSLIVTFYLTEPESKTKKSLTQPLYYSFE